MRENHSKSAFLYQQVRRAIQSGRYLPGQRIDPGTLASEFSTSPTPVRFALYRLVGEGMLEDHARNGLYVPLPNELGLRDLYDWMQRLLLIACDMEPSSFIAKTDPSRRTIAAGGDLVKMTWQLFDDIARVTGHRSLHRAVKQANDRLASIRRGKQSLIDDASDELSYLARHWHQDNMSALKEGIHDYHERRKTLAPCIVALLSDNSRRLH